MGQSNGKMYIISVFFLAEKVEKGRKNEKRKDNVREERRGERERGGKESEE